MSSDSTIATDDTAIGDTLAVPGLEASVSREVDIELRADATASPGVLVGICVAPVPGESNTANDCSGAVEVTIASSRPTDRGGDKPPARFLVVRQVRPPGG